MVFDNVTGAVWLRGSNLDFVKAVGTVIICDCSGPCCGAAKVQGVALVVVVVVLCYLTVLSSLFQAVILRLKTVNKGYRFIERTVVLF